MTFISLRREKCTWDKMRISEMSRINKKGEKTWYREAENAPGAAVWGGGPAAPGARAQVSGSFSASLSAVPKAGARRAFISKHDSKISS